MSVYPAEQANQARAIFAKIAHERAAYLLARDTGDEPLAHHHLLTVMTLIRELDFIMPPCRACGLLGCDCDLPDDD